MRTTNLSDPHAQDKRSVRMTLSGEQRAALDVICHWYRHSDKPVFKLTGAAGTGKTKLAVLAGHEIGSAQFASFTGKAASVLRRRSGDNAVTLHSLIYGAPSVERGRDGRERLHWQRRRERHNASLVVADECSMIEGQLGRDLLATGPRVLVTGDDFQLPPVSGHAYFDGPANYTLREVHRQAAGSQPLRLATAIREGEEIETERFDMERLCAADVVICATNVIRRKLNRLIRKERGITDREPVVGDTVCCFRNNYDAGVLNGTLWQIARIVEDGPVLELKLRDDIGDEVDVYVPERCFTAGPPVNLSTIPRELDIFDYGYALTAWKAQGSEWDRVVVVDEIETREFRWIARQSGLDPNEFTARWLYTAVTRARDHVDLMRAPR